MVVISLMPLFSYVILVSRFLDVRSWLTEMDPPRACDVCASPPDKILKPIYAIALNFGWFSHTKTRVLEVFYLHFRTVLTAPAFIRI